LPYKKSKAKYDDGLCEKKPERFSGKVFKDRKWEGHISHVPPEPQRKKFKYRGKRSNRLTYNRIQATENHAPAYPSALTQPLAHNYSIMINVIDTSNHAM